MDSARPSDHAINLPGVHHKVRDPAAGPKELRFPLIGFLPNKIRNHFIAFMGEFVGTFLFLFFAFSATQVANAAASGGQTQGGSLSQVPNASTLLYISLAFGFSLAVNAWVFFRISGGLFNPAVTMGMALIGAVPWVRAGIVFVAQILGSLAASGVVSCLFPGALNVQTTLGGGTSIVRGLFIEMFLTAMLVFTIFMLAAEKHKGTFLAPIGIGLAMFIAELSGVYFTGGSLNPARSFGPAVVNHDFHGYHWIYWVGPGLGALLAVTFYRFVKILEYETANPGQDFNDKEAEVFQEHYDEENAATGADVARPVVAVGHPDYVADGLGLHRSNESNQIPGGSDRGYSVPGSGPTNGPLPDGNTAGRTIAPTSPGAGVIGGEKVRPNSADSYNQGPAAEAGNGTGMGTQELGGNYRVSGL